MADQILRHVPVEDWSSTQALKVKTSPSSFQSGHPGNATARPKLDQWFKNTFPGTVDLASGQSASGTSFFHPDDRKQIDAGINAGLGARAKAGMPETLTGDAGDTVLTGGSGNDTLTDQKAPEAQALIDKIATDEGLDKTQRSDVQDHFAKPTSHASPEDQRIALAALQARIRGAALSKRGFQPANAEDTQAFDHRFQRTGSSDSERSTKNPSSTIQVAQSTQPAASQTSSQTPPPPANKKSWFADPVKAQGRADFYASTGKLNNVTQQEREAYLAVLDQEGGLVKHQGGKSNTYAGITFGTLDEFSRNGKTQVVSSGSPTPLPESLTPDQVAQFYNDYFDDALRETKQPNALASIPDAKGRNALADTLYRQGRSGGAEVIQKAINRVVPGAIPPRHPGENAVVGKTTLREFKRLLADPNTRDRLLNAVADERDAREPGEKNRHGNFRP
ncbi:glycosyl hydrolase 108 family protein [Magnetospira thiophila]